MVQPCIVVVEATIAIGTSVVIIIVIYIFYYFFIDIIIIFLLSLWFVVIKRVFVSWLLYLTFLSLFSRLSCSASSSPNRLLLIVAHLELFEHLYKQWLLIGPFVINPCLPCQFLARLCLFVLECSLGSVDRQGILHAVKVKIFLDEVRNKATLLALVNFLGSWVLPLETCSLLGSWLCVLFDSFENART